MLQIECRKIGDILLLDLVGRMAGGPETNAVKDTIKSEVADGQRMFILDMSELGWMNSTGIGVLVEAYVSVKRAEGTLVLVSPSERVTHVLEGTQLIPDVFNVYGSEEDAVAQLASATESDAS